MNVFPLNGRLLRTPALAPKGRCQGRALATTLNDKQEKAVALTALLLICIPCCFHCISFPVQIQCPLISA
jgi:hypothetical protein